MRREPAEYNWRRLQFDETVLSEIPGYPRRSSPRGNQQVQYVVVHHMAMIGKGDGKANDACVVAWRRRQASAHYGVDGVYVRQFVWDRDSAWAVGNLTANRRSISIEHANSTRGPTWMVSLRTWRRGARLAGTLCWVYGLGVPEAGVTIRRHRDACGGCTECPGPYLGKVIWLAYVRRARKVYQRLVAG